jgi:shikimate kinase
VALATVAALRKSLDDLAVVNLGVDAAFDARVTVTGAFDDACASFFGGIVVTDNLKRRLVKHSILPEGFICPVPCALQEGLHGRLQRGKTANC